MRRRHRLSVDTFPFLAVLLCAMGALILILLVMDRRSRLAAAARARDSARQAIQEIEEEIVPTEDDKRIEAENKALDAEMHRVQARLAAVAQDLRREEVGVNTLRRTVQAKQIDLKGHERALQTAQKEAVVLKANLTMEDRARNELAAQLVQLEQVIRELQSARQRDALTYSVIPYKGKHGEQRRPLYVECTGFGFLFHPDRFEMIDPSTPLLSEEISRRVVRIAENRRKAGRPAERPYLMMLIRPEGIMRYYQVQAAVRDLPVEFGYEVVDADWVLAIPPERDELAGTAGPSLSKPTPSEPNRTASVGAGTSAAGGGTGGGSSLPGGNSRGGGNAVAGLSGGTNRGNGFGLPGNAPGGSGWLGGGSPGNSTAGGSGGLFGNASGGPGGPGGRSPGGSVGGLFGNASGGSGGPGGLAGSGGPGGGSPGNSTAGGSGGQFGNASGGPGGPGGRSTGGSVGGLFGNPSGGSSGPGGPGGRSPGNFTAGGSSGQIGNASGGSGGPSGPGGPGGQSTGNPTAGRSGGTPSNVGLCLGSAMGQPAGGSGSGSPDGRNLSGGVAGSGASGPGSPAGSRGGSGQATAGLGSSPTGSSLFGGTGPNRSPSGSVGMLSGPGGGGQGSSPGAIPGLGGGGSGGAGIASADGLMKPLFDNSLSPNTSNAIAKASSAIQIPSILPNLAANTAGGAGNGSAGGAGNGSAGGAGNASAGGAGNGSAGGAGNGSAGGAGNASAGGAGSPSAGGAGSPSAGAGSPPTGASVPPAGATPPAGGGIPSTIVVTAPQSASTPPAPSSGRSSSGGSPGGGGEGGERVQREGFHGADSLAPARPRFRPLLPARIGASEDTTLFIECRSTGVVIYPVGQSIPFAALDREPSNNPLYRTVMAQLALHKGDPERRHIRFLIHRDAERTFHMTYPVLDNVKVDKTRYTMQPGDEISRLTQVD